MRRRSFWKLPLAALAAVVLPQGVPAATPALPAPIPFSEDELDAVDGTMSGYAIEQMRLEAALDWIRDSPWYQRYLDQKVMQRLGYADLIERPAPYDITLNGVGYMLGNPGFSMGQTLRIPHYRNLSAGDAWSPVKPDDLTDVVRVDFDSNDVPIAFTAEGDA